MGARFPCLGDQHFFGAFSCGYWWFGVGPNLRAGHFLHRRLDGLELCGFWDGVLVYPFALCVMVTDGLLIRKSLVQGISMALHARHSKIYSYNITPSRPVERSALTPLTS